MRFMNKKLKVSVAVCTCNSSKYINDLLLSIQNQVVRVDEVIICDDCSVDATLKIVDHFKSQSELNIKVLYSSIPIGRFKNIERAISNCTGEIIIIAIPEYIWKCDRVKKILGWFDINRNKSILYTDVELIDVKTKASMSLLKKMNMKGKRSNDISIDSFEYHDALFSTFAFKKDFDNNTYSKHVPHNIDYGYMLSLYAIDKGQLGYLDEMTVTRLYFAYENNSLTHPNFYSLRLYDDEYKRIYENLPALSKNTIIKMRFLNERVRYSGRIVIKNIKRYVQFYGLKFVGEMLCDLKKVLGTRIKTILCRKKRNCLQQDFSYTKKKYASWIYDLKNNKTLFVPFTQNPYKRDLKDPKVFAFYLPQYHSIPENDDAHGKGFTEWTNVASCVPQFVGHYQPKIPYDVGFYDLTKPGILERQVEIAKAYGIYGFCYYYYWFSGRKVLEKPLEYFLRSDIDFHFHFCWANENWSKLWDGGNREVILEQNLMDGDADKFFSDILPYIKDDRYEKIANKPILIIYRPSLFDRNKIRIFFMRLNDLAVKNGFDGFYLLMTNALGNDSPIDYNIDGMVEFPPHRFGCNEIEVDKLDGMANCAVYDMNSFIKERKYIYDVDYQLFKSCFPSWDNLPRKLYSRGGCYLLSDSCFESWLDGVFEWTRENNANDKQYVYINAWNEWGEGAILEPTTRFGYKYLDIVRRCIEKTRKY